MADDKKSLSVVHDQHRAENAKYYEDHLKHWRAWGSWFSWGSPVGLGLFFLAVAGSAWILSQAFGWS
jgi:hypothetical protein